MDANTYHDLIAGGFTPAAIRHAAGKCKGHIYRVLCTECVREYEHRHCLGCPDC